MSYPGKTVPAGAKTTGSGNTVVSRIGFETAGTLVELHADHGDSVAAGNLLARLDSRERQARVARAGAAVTQAGAAIEQAPASVERAPAQRYEKRRMFPSRPAAVPIDARDGHGDVRGCTPGRR